jgi:hypothetical protein
LTDDQRSVEDHRHNIPLYQRCNSPLSVMSTQLVTTTIPVPTSVNQMQADVIAALERQGDPLRWSITKVAAGLLYIEAIVTCDEAA